MEAMMGLDQIVAEIRNRPGFAENAGMILLHNGIARAWSRDTHKKVIGIEVCADERRIGAICQEIGARDGIFAITAEANQGYLKPGDDLLYLAVAGDIRENVIAAFTELLNRIKNEAITKKEIFEE